MPRYQLTDEELLALHQDQIDADLKEEQRILAAMERAHDAEAVSNPEVIIGATKQAYRAKLKIVREELEKTKTKAKAVEDRIKAKK